mmetsp:Transcript_31672/g.61800  ORF Transcript_31672/g.61800 Transcript_31672/m.61800 type:complete len:244 (-) Transcript_31672:5395-6126(-)
MSGYLFKTGGFVKGFKRRYFRFSLANPAAPALVYSKNEQSNKLLGQIPCKGAMVHSYAGNSFARVKSAYHFSVKPFCNARTYVLEASGRGVRRRWIRSMVGHGAIFAGHRDGEDQKGRVPVPWAMKEAYLEKMGKTASESGWRVRYFVLFSPASTEKTGPPFVGAPSRGLVYYKNASAALKGGRKLGCVDLSGNFGLSKLQLTTFGNQHCFSICHSAHVREYIISAASEKVCRQWMAAINSLK